MIRAAASEVKMVGYRGANSYVVMRFLVVTVIMRDLSMIMLLPRLVASG